MKVQEQYQERVLVYGREEEKFRKIAAKFPLYRLLVFLAGAFAFYFAFTISIGLAIGIALLFLIFFVIVTKLDLKYNERRKHFGILREINENEIKGLEGNYKIYPEGSRYIDAGHPYTSDLDIFGKASLFQYINRSTSNAGSDLLAEMLKSPADTREIYERQDAVRELSLMVDWRQELQAAGIEFEENLQDQNEIFQWLNEKPLFLHKKYLSIIATVMPLITIGLGIAYFYDLPQGYFFLALVVQGAIIFLNGGKINYSYQNISKKVEILKQYAALIKIIEGTKYRSTRLAGLKKRFELENATASDNLKRLSSYVNYLDFRLNIYFWAPLNLLTFWDIHWIMKTEKWREKNKGKVMQWFSALGEFEALASFGNLCFNNPEWAFPEISQKEFLIDAVDAGHPLLKPEQRVSNSFAIDGKGKIMLVTGSNMAGKSTFLRTAGVNAVLAMAGAPVCAKGFKISPMQVFTSMRIIDSLEENASSFYAELKRLREVIEAVNKHENIFFLLDEILRGTNSNDRHIGSKALIKQMVKYNGNGIIATHDLELGKLEGELPGNIDNYSFDVQIEGERLYFDYKLHPGICKSLNASILMKKMGIEVGLANG